jgi:hypothetical protein
MAAIPSSSTIVHLLEDVDRSTFFTAVEAFGKDLAEHSQSLEVAFVFLASHGFQFGSKLYIATSDCTVTKQTAFKTDPASGNSLPVERWLRDVTVSIDGMMAALRRLYTGPLVLIVDACRVAPIPGLAFVPSEMINCMNYVENTLVCLSTSVGSPACDNDGDDEKHSMFCSALLESLFCVGASVVSAINTACLSTGLNQRPVMASVQFRDVHLVPKLCVVIVVDFGRPSFNSATFLHQLERLQERHARHREDLAVVHVGTPPAVVTSHLERRKIGLLCWSDASVALVDAREVDCDEVIPRLFQMWIRCCER